MDDGTPYTCEEFEALLGPFVREHYHRIKQAKLPSKYLVAKCKAYKCDLIQDICMQVKDC